MGCSRIAGVTSSEELGAMSKNTLRGISLGIRPIPRIHSLTLIISCLILFVHVNENVSVTYRKGAFIWDDPNQVGSRLVKRTDESLPKVESLVPLIYTMV